MTPELVALTLAALLQCVQLISYAIPVNRELGPAYTTSARDRPPDRQVSDVTARLGRALDNHFEGLILFGIGVGVIQMSGQTTWFTALCAWVYLAARVVYIPAYAMGLQPWRSVIWAIGFMATALLYLAALV